MRFPRRIKARHAHKWNSPTLPPLTKPASCKKKVTWGAGIEHVDAKDADVKCWGSIHFSASFSFRFAVFLGGCFVREPPQCFFCSRLPPLRGASATRLYSQGYFGRCAVEGLLKTTLDTLGPSGPTLVDALRYARWAGVYWSPKTQQPQSWEKTKISFLSQNSNKTPQILEIWLLRIILVGTYVHRGLFHRDARKIWLNFFCFDLLSHK